MTEPNQPYNSGGGDNPGNGGGGGQSDNGQGGGAAAWYGELPADKPQEFRDWIQNKGFKDPVSALESYYNAEKLLGGPSDQLLRLPKPDDKAGWEQVWNRLGRPEKPEGYELPVPEGDDGQFAQMAAQVFHQAGVPKAAAQQVVQGIYEAVAKSRQEARAELEAQAEKELNDLKAEWGAEFEKRSEFARRGLRAYGEKAGLSQEDLTALELALGTAKMVKVFHALGETTAEHDLGGSGDAAAFGLSPAQAREKLEEARLKRAKGEMGEKDYFAIVDRYGPIAAKAAN